MGRVEKSLQHLSWHHAIGCVLDVFHENQRKESEDRGIKAMADLWCINDNLRLKIHERARRYWAIRTEKDQRYFPYSIDAVATLYLKIRKRQSDEIEAFDADVFEAESAGKHRELFTIADEV